MSLCKNSVQIACEYQNEYPLKENGTILIVAQMKTIYLQDKLLQKDGWVCLEKEM